MKVLNEIEKSSVPWLSKDRQRIASSSGRIANRIRKAFRESDITLDPEADRIPTDIGDMLEVLAFLQLSIASLTSNRKPKSRARATALLHVILNDLYIHMDYHFKGMKKPLERLIQELDASGARKPERLVRKKRTTHRKTTA